MDIGYGQYIVVTIAIITAIQWTLMLHFGYMDTDITNKVGIMAALR